MLETEYAYNDHLKELHASEFEMADGEPDIRNWKVIGLQNQEVGKVSELIFDEISRRVRYLIVQINGKPLNLISRSVIVPIGLAELLTDEKVVLLPGLTINHLASLPAYEKAKISRKTEYAVRNVFSPTDGFTEIRDSLNQRDGFYDHRHFNDEKFHRPYRDVPQKNGLKEEIKENIERVKESVRKMEDDIEKLERTNR